MIPTSTLKYRHFIIPTLRDLPLLYVYLTLGCANVRSFEQDMMNDELAATLKRLTAVHRILSSL